MNTLTHQLMTDMIIPIEHCCHVIEKSVGSKIIYSLGVLLYQMAHLSKCPSDLDQNGTQEKKPVKGDRFSCHFIWLDPILTG